MILCRRAGTGIQDGLKNHWEQSHVGSTPTGGIKIKIKGGSVNGKFLRSFLLSKEYQGGKNY